MQETVCTERARAATLRISFSGTRTLVATSTSDLKKYMAGKGVPNANPDQLMQFMKSMSRETLEKYIAAGCKLYHATIGPGDAVILPFDTTWCEAIGADVDSAGVRCTFFFHADVDSINVTNRWLIGMKKANTMLQSAMECLIVETAAKGVAVADGEVATAAAAS